MMNSNVACEEGRLCETKRENLAVVVNETGVCLFGENSPVKDEGQKDVNSMYSQMLAQSVVAKNICKVLQTILNSWGRDSGD